MSLRPTNWSLLMRGFAVQAVGQVTYGVLPTPTNDNNRD